MTLHKIYGRYTVVNFARLYIFSRTRKKKVLYISYYISSISKNTIYNVYIYIPCVRVHHRRHIMHYLCQGVSFSYEITFCAI
ncbi:hypothetical protein GDO81_011347 [Engystomops pustulosus]|uniref:Uncharacterized protein n=1 Tax=Engystomops pustulosus TaxID=76066 RepID=A0AAV7BDE2_ENGPU|nr:hypothetical protein GDO81_011347 [Engystomops pustulosus]